MENLDSENMSSGNDAQFTANSIVTDDEDDTSYERIPNNDSGSCCYRRKGRGAIKTSTKPYKNGHVRTKSE